MNSAIIQMGKFGDITNILPLVKMIAEEDGEPPFVFTAEGYASLLSGVSYARVGRFTIPDHGVAGRALRKSFDRVLDTTVCGAGITYQRRCDSFTREAWDRVGMLPFWGRPVVFDRRDGEREKALAARHVKTGKPLLLVNVTGASSPYPFAARLLADIRFRHGEEFEILNLASVQAVEFYDLLGLYSMAAGLISSDTATLHLAAASDVPFAGLLSDAPTLWHGGVPQRNPGLTLRYAESMARVELLHEWIDSLIQRRRSTACAHVFLDYPMDPDGTRRNRIARETWKSLYSRSEVRPLPVMIEQVRRTFNDGKRVLPYLKDVLTYAFHFGFERILLSNSDTCFAPKLAGEVMDRPAWGGRRDFKKLAGVLDQETVEKGDAYVGSDIFVIPRQWWKSVESQFPDMLLGAEGWDCCLRELMRATGGMELENCCYHERHDSLWERAENRWTLTSQAHNQRLAIAFLTSLEINPVLHGFRP